MGFNWSSPVSNLSINTFIGTENDIATNGSGNDQYAIGTYTNTTAAAYPGNTWLNYTTSTVGTAGNFEPGKGYQMASSGSEVGLGKKLLFLDSPNTGIGNEPVTNETGNPGENDQSNGTKFNLVSNPYPSFISVTSFISANSSVLQAGIHQAVYGWNGSGYDTYNKFNWWIYCSCSRIHGWSTICF